MTKEDCLKWLDWCANNDYLNGTAKIKARAAAQMAIYALLDEPCDEYIRTQVRWVERFADSIHDIDPDKARQLYTVAIDLKQLSARCEGLEAIIKAKVDEERERVLGK